jgi:hypothetical protein
MTGKLAEIVVIPSSVHKSGNVIAKSLKCIFIINGGKKCVLKAWGQMADKLKTIKPDEEVTLDVSLVTHSHMVKNIPVTGMYLNANKLVTD